jgi:hypothetical protein
MKRVEDRCVLGLKCQRHRAVVETLEGPVGGCGGRPHRGRAGVAQRGPGHDLPAKHLLRRGGGLIRGVWME